VKEELMRLVVIPWIELGSGKKESELLPGDYPLGCIPLKSVLKEYAQILSQFIMLHCLPVVVIYAHRQSITTSTMLMHDSLPHKILCYTTQITEARQFSDLR
jgi:hypothetical protein